MASVTTPVAPDHGTFRTGHIPVAVNAGDVPKPVDLDKVGDDVRRVAQKHYSDPDKIIREASLAIDGIDFPDYRRRMKERLADIIDPTKPVDPDLEEDVYRRMPSVFNKKVGIRYPDLKKVAEGLAGKELAGSEPVDYIEFDERVGSGRESFRVNILLADGSKKKAVLIDDDGVDAKLTREFFALARIPCAKVEAADKGFALAEWVDGEQFQPYSLEKDGRPNVPLIKALGRLARMEGFMSSDIGYSDNQIISAKTGKLTLFDFEYHGVPERRSGEDGKDEVLALTRSRLWKDHRQQMLEAFEQGFMDTDADIKGRWGEFSDLLESAKRDETSKVTDLHQIYALGNIDRDPSEILRRIYARVSMTNEGNDNFWMPHIRRHLKNSPEK